MTTTTTTTTASKVKLCNYLANACQALRNIEEKNRDDYFNHPFYKKWIQRIESAKSVLPSGSGIECNFHWSDEDCGLDQLVFKVNYHCMNEFGFYIGYIDSIVTVTPQSMTGYKFNFKHDIDGIDPGEYLEGSPELDIYENMICELLKLTLEKEIIYDDLFYDVKPTQPYNKGQY